MLVSLAYTPISDIALAWENEKKEERNGAVHLRIARGSYQMEGREE